MADTWTQAETILIRQMRPCGGPIRWLETRAKKLGVKLIAHDIEDTIYISWIKRETGAPGAGAAVVRIVQEYARKRRKVVKLECERPLLGFYQSLGFIGEPDGDGDYDMVWTP